MEGGHIIAHTCPAGLRAVGIQVAKPGHIGNALAVCIEARVIAMLLQAGLGATIAWCYILAELAFVFKARSEDSEVHANIVGTLCINLEEFCLALPADLHAHSHDAPLLLFQMMNWADSTTRLCRTRASDAPEQLHSN